MIDTVCGYIVVVELRHLYHIMYIIISHRTSHIEILLITNKSTILHVEKE